MVTKKKQIGAVNKAQSCCMGRMTPNQPFVFFFQITIVIVNVSTHQSEN